MIKTKYWYSYTTGCRVGNVMAKNMNDAAKKAFHILIGNHGKSDKVFRLDFLVKKGKNRF